MPRGPLGIYVPVASYILARHRNQVYAVPDVLHAASNADDSVLSQLSVSEYIRRLLLHRKIPIYPIVIHDDRELIEELHKINKVGNNLNQIARYLNQGGVLTNPLAKQSGVSRSSPGPHTILLSQSRTQTGRPVCCASRNMLS